MSFVYWDTFSSSFPVWIPLLFFPVWLLWLEVPIQCWIAIVKAGIFVLFLILRGKTLAFYHWVLCYLWGFCQCLYSWWGSSVLFLVFWVFLSWRVLIFFKCLFWVSWDIVCVCVCVVCVVCVCVVCVCVCGVCMCGVWCVCVCVCSMCGVCVLWCVCVCVCGMCFQLLWGITLTAFFMVNHFCTPAVNHTWSQCVIF